MNLTMVKDALTFIDKSTFMKHRCVILWGKISLSDVNIWNRVIWLKYEQARQKGGYWSVTTYTQCTKTHTHTQTQREGRRFRVTSTYNSPEEMIIFVINKHSKLKKSSVILTEWNLLLFKQKDQCKILSCARICRYPQIGERYLS